MSPPLQKSLTLQVGARQRGLLGIVRQGPPPQLRNKKRRLSRLPTIAEADCEDAEEGPAVPSGLPPCLTDPLSIASSAAMAEAVLVRLKSSSKGDRSTLLAWLCTALPPLALSDMGSVVAQLACNVAAGSDRTMLTAKLQGSVVDLCMSQHGHLVLTTMIETMPVSMIAFVVDEVAGRAGELARNRFGYRVLEAMTMHCSEEQFAPLAKELVLEALDLSKHVHGNFVMQHLLEYGTEACRAHIIRCLLPELPSLAMDRTGSRVVEVALGHSESQEQCLIARALIYAGQPVSLADIACSRCGSAIVTEIATVDACAQESRLGLVACLPRLVQSKFGRRVVAHFELMVPVAVQS